MFQNADKKVQKLGIHSFNTSEYCYVFPSWCYQSVSFIQWVVQWTTPRGVMSIQTPDSTYWIKLSIFKNQGAPSCNTVISGKPNSSTSFALNDHFTESNTPHGNFMEHLPLWPLILSNGVSILPCKSILRDDTEQERENDIKTDWGKKKVLKSESEVKWNRWKKGDGEEKRQKELMGSGAGPDFYWRLGLALARRDKREIIIRPAEAWQPLLGTAERQTEHYVKDWPCHWQRHLLTDSGVWSFSWW